MSQDNFADIIPYGDLGIIALESSRAIGEKVDNYVSSWRNESRNDEESIHFTSYKKDSYLIDAVCPRFGSGESKGLLNESVRGKDLYIYSEQNACAYKTKSLHINLWRLLLALYNRKGYFSSNVASLLSSSIVSLSSRSNQPNPR